MLLYGHQRPQLRPTCHSHESVRAIHVCKLSRLRDRSWVIETRNGGDGRAPGEAQELRPVRRSTIGSTEARRVVEAWWASGLTLSEYARRRGIRARRLSRWAARLDVAAEAAARRFHRVRLMPSVAEHEDRADRSSSPSARSAACECLPDSERWTCADPIDYAADGTPPGIEIVSPIGVRMDDIYGAFDRLGLPRSEPAELSPLRAA
jgi:hypothetical protein